MARTPGRLFHVTSLARRDIAAILKRSFQEFGMSAALRYKALIRQALLDIEADPERQGTRERPEIMVEGARTYHITLSRTRVTGSTVKEPRHFLLYRKREDGVVEIARVLHDGRDLDRHLPEEFRRTSADE
ncbi:MAG: type II toxin-antitoxin system RelE/ParE family toxin [Bryobacteraceae bacterium]